MINDSEKDHVRRYPHARPVAKMQSRLDELTIQYLSLSRNALERRIQLSYRIGCFRYALGNSDTEITAAFSSACEAIPFLLAREMRSIDSSLALAFWGIAAIANRCDIWESLTSLDCGRLGSEHIAPRYNRMLAALFRALQSLASENGNVDGAIADYDSEDRSKKRIKSRAFNDARIWSRGLRDIIDSTRSGYLAVEDSLGKRVRYLDDSYVREDDLCDHEGLLDVHGLSIVAAMSRRGWIVKTNGVALPIALVWQKQASIDDGPAI